MFKKLLILLMFLFSCCFAAYEPYLPKGSLIKVQTKVPYTTQNLEVGSKVYFIAPSDVWVSEKKVIEKGDIFEGFVSMLKLPVQGINAAMSIDIVDIVKLDGSTYEFSGRLIFSSSHILGGNLTNPLSYNKTIHPRKVYGNPWGGTLQYVPSGEYEFGQHVGIGYRDLLFIETLEDYYN